jgi:hypothetical protein
MELKPEPDSRAPRLGLPRLTQSATERCDGPRRYATGGGVAVVITHRPAFYPLCGRIECPERVRRRSILYRGGIGSSGWIVDLRGSRGKPRDCTDSRRSDNHNPSKRNLAGRIQLRKQQPLEGRRVAGYCRPWEFAASRSRCRLGQRNHAAPRLSESVRLTVRAHEVIA